MPEDDALIRFILRQFAEEAEDGQRKIVFYIGPSPNKNKMKGLRQVFPSIDLSDVPKVVLYEGGFDAFAAECLTMVEDADA